MRDIAWMYDSHGTYYVLLNADNNVLLIRDVRDSLKFDLRCYTGAVTLYY